MTCLALAVFDAQQSAHCSLQVLQHTCLIRSRTHSSQAGSSLLHNCKATFCFGGHSYRLDDWALNAAFPSVAHSRLTPLTLSGSGFGADANDAAQFAELKTQGDLTRRAWERDVQVCLLISSCEEGCKPTLAAPSHYLQKHP